MTRLIDADELHEIVNWSHEKPPYSKKKIHRIIDMARTVDAQPVRYSRWIRDEFGTRCGVCGLYAYRDKFDQPWKSPYCPNCGAKMDAEQEKQNDND